MSSEMDDLQIVLQSLTLEVIKPNSTSLPCSFQEAL